nr:hypothetical protein [Tanacetum cinerariifolium]
MLLVAPPSPDYVPGPEKPQTLPAPQDENEHEPMFIQPHDLDFMPEPIYPEYIPLEDEHILLAKEQALPPVVSPTAESPEYVAESDLEEDPEEYEDDETEDGSIYYPMNGGDDGDDDDGDSSGDDVDDEDEDEEEEEHLALTDFVVVIPTDELAAISFPPEAEVERLLVMPTLSPSPLALLSPPFVGERLARCTAPDASPLPPPQHMPPLVDHRDDIPETEMPPHNRLCLSTLGSSTLDAEARRRGIGEVGYDIRDTWVDPTETVHEITPITVGERVDLLMEDRIAHQETIQIVEDKAAREAWAHLIRLSQAVHSKFQTHQEQVYAHEFQMKQTEIVELRETDHRRQAQMVKTLRVMEDMRREMSDMQAELLALREQSRRAGQPGGDARVPNYQDAPKDADTAGQPPAAAGHHHTAAAGHHHLRPTAVGGKVFRRDFPANPKITPSSPIYKIHRHATPPQPPLNSPPLPPTTKAATTRPSSPHPAATAAYTTTSHHLHHHGINNAISHPLPPTITTIVTIAAQPPCLVMGLTAHKGAFGFVVNCPLGAFGSVDSSPKGAFVCCVFVLTNSGLKTLNTIRHPSSRAAVSVNTARPINTAYPRSAVNGVKPSSNVFHKSHLLVRRTFNQRTTTQNSDLKETVNTAKGNPQQALQEKGVIDSPKSAVNLSPSSSALSGEQDDMIKKKDKGKSHVKYFTGNRDFNADFDDYSEDSSNNVSAAEADFNNLGTFITISPILTTRTHKDHPVAETIGDLSLTSQIRKEPKRVHQALKDPSWIEAMQEELLQFKMQNVWILVDFPHGTKWVFRNKKDKRGIVIRNKAKLVSQGHTQEEGIDYDEVFALVARINAIRLFLSYASFKDVVVYQMDVKSAFLYGNIEEEIYVCQPPGFEDPYFPDKVYKVKKALYGLIKLLEHGLQVKHKQDGIFVSHDKYVAEILKKYGFIEVKNASTPIETQKPLLKNKDGEEVDVHMYRSMIGSLMYLTSSRPDIMFIVCACTRYQVNPKVSHLHAVKRIF